MREQTQAACCRVLRAPLLAALALLLTGCSSPTFMNPASTTTAELARLYQVILVLSAIVFVVVEGLLVYNIVRFRDRPGDNRLPDQTHGNTRLEVIWTAIPLLLVAVLFVFTVRTTFAMAAPRPQPGDLKVHVIGHRWWWEFRYPDLGIVTANELHVPQGVVVQIDLDSVDVIHSFWVPRLAGKMDVIPGQTNHTWFNASETGEFKGHCAEYCGLNHANMRMHVIVQTRAEFDAWAANQQGPPAVPQTALQKEGQQIVTTGICRNCHTLGDSQSIQPIGPDLTHLYSRKTFAGSTFDLNELNLRHWLQHSAQMKPGNDMSAISPSTEQVDALIAYLTTLK